MSDNWQCRTMHVLRDLVESSRVYGEDESAGLLPCDPEDGGFLALVWYKQRGRTTTAVWLRECAEAPVRPLTLEVAERAMAYAEQLTPRRWA